MVSVSLLDNEISRHEADAESKRKLAESLQNKAQAHEASGDEVRAQLDRDSADRYMQDAEREEQLAASFIAQKVNRERKANDIDKEIENVRREYDKRLSDLESKKKQILH